MQQQVHDGADGIKIFAGSIENDGVQIMPLDMAKATVAEAHRLGRPVLVAPMGGPWTPELIGRLKAAHMGLIPTLTLFDVEAKKAHVSPEENQGWIDAAAQQLKAYSGAGGQILFGTDVGYTDHYDTTEEYVLMSKAGMPFAQILASLPTNPAERFGNFSHSGRMAKHMDADLTVFDSDPGHGYRSILEGPLHYSRRQDHL